MMERNKFVIEMDGKILTFTLELIIIIGTKREAVFPSMSAARLSLEIK